MEVGPRQKHSTGCEDVNQRARNDNFRPVISAHKGAEGEYADQEKDGCAGVSGTFPEDSGADDKDEDFLHKPDDG